MARILVVDDDEVIRKVISRQLEPHGYFVETAANGVEALKMVAETHFDLIVADENMPEMGGILLLETLRHQKNLILVILIGGYVQDWRVEELKKKGFAAVLGKPLSVEKVLLPAIREALGQ